MKCRRQGLGAFEGFDIMYISGSLTTSSLPSAASSWSDPVPLLHSMWGLRYSWEVVHGHGGEQVLSLVSKRMCGGGEVVVLNLGLWEGVRKCHLGHGPQECSHSHPDLLALWPPRGKQNCGEACWLQLCGQGEGLEPGVRDEATVSEAELGGFPPHRAAAHQGWPLAPNPPSVL